MVVIALRFGTLPCSAGAALLCHAMLCPTVPGGAIRCHALPSHARLPLRCIPLPSYAVRYSAHHLSNLLFQPTKHVGDPLEVGIAPFQRFDELPGLGENSDP